MKSSDLIISAAVAQARDSTAVMRYADVTAVAGRTITVDLGGVEVSGIPCIGSYVEPLVGDRAWLVMQGSTLAAIGSGTLTGTPASAASFAYTHTQGSPASTWSITHNLGWRPNVQVFDSGGTEVFGAITHDSVNSLTITFTAGGAPSAFSGVAYLS